MTTRATRGLHFVIALLVVVLDRAAKAIVAKDISLHETIQVIPGFFRLTHVENRGAAFGLFADSPSEWKIFEIDQENRPAHQLIAENFEGWIPGAIRECVDQFRDRLPEGTDLEALATYVLAVMEGGVMLSRSYGAVEPFDRAVQQLRQHFQLLCAHGRLQEQAAEDISPDASCSDVFKAVAAELAPNSLGTPSANVHECNLFATGGCTC